MADVSYDLSEAAFAANESEDTWVQHLLGVLITSFQAVQPLLTSANADALIALVLDKACRI